ncbi:tRNA-binding protein [Nonlabens spongiae]|uniref:tRNA-binding protein n=1 Tax=Nonlabens spongiae TaxID=331648 RepID=A0A1W6MGI2_9FLAO|nr:tRNA-binding protein [Nonlabens spongiae]ARN76713.1 tRNA-binding protein [Nonlabens spongiae]
MLSWEDFKKVEMRVGTVLRASAFSEARSPAYKIEIDMGELGILKTSAQITELYNTDDLVGKQVIAVVNFPKKQIANFMSECLILGVLGDDKGVTLLTADKPVKNGSLIG